MRFFRLTSCKSTGIRQFQNLKIFSTVEFIERETTAKYSKEFKEQALLLPDERGVKKAAEQLGINYYTLAERRQAGSRKAERIASDKTPLSDRELAIQREMYLRQSSRHKNSLFELHVFHIQNKQPPEFCSSDLNECACGYTRIQCIQKSSCKRRLHLYIS